MLTLSRVAALLLLISQNLVAQDLPPIFKEKPKRGIYTSFKEFYDNQPSITWDFSVKHRSKGKQFLVGGGDYAIVFNDESIKGSTRLYWGFSTGDSVFINIHNYDPNVFGYVTLQGMGRYCYVKGKTNGGGLSPMAATGGGVGMGIMMSIPVEAGFILNINNGNFYQLRPQLMEKILAKDEALLVAYQQENKKKDADLMLLYIEQYNKKHADEIGQKEKTSKVVVYRREKKEKRDTVLFMTGDSTMYRMVPGDLKTIESTEKTIRLCVGKDCQDFPVYNDATNFIECIFKDGEIKPILTRKEKKVGEFYVNEIQRIIEKRDEDTEE